MRTLAGEIILNFFLNFFLSKQVLQNRGKMGSHQMAQAATSLVPGGTHEKKKTSLIAFFLLSKWQEQLRVTRNFIATI